MITDAMLPTIFAALMALAILIYAILDGYDLGVGILLPLDNEHDRDQMIASIGPFWDANETWLVLAVGLMLIAFPGAYNVILKALYLPATIMLIGLILRGVAFDFRAKVAQGNKGTWDIIFKLGSIIASSGQGYMLGMYVMGFDNSVNAILFACLSGFGITMAYAYIGAAWLVMKTDRELQLKAVSWAKLAGRISFTGILSVCIINPLINPQVFERWTTLPLAFFIAAIPVFCFAFFYLGDRVLKRLPLADDSGCWLPFVIAMLVFICCFSGLAISFYPFVIPGQLTISQAASAPESLRFILYGALFVIPCILAYTIFSYRVFWGKVDALRYY
ncbi:MAG: cytochrome d ubiquinol oxidase subunit II [Paraglaciecola sp.]|jgi:cytochrome d ubiquinol oxidase subunit II